MSDWLLNAAEAIYFKDSSGNQRTVKAVYFKPYQGNEVQVWPTDFHVEEVYIVRLDNQGYIIGEPIQYTYNITDEIPNIPDLEPNSKYAIYGTIVDGKGTRYEECWYQAYTGESGGMHNDKNVWSDSSSQEIVSFISSNKTKSNNISDDPSNLAYTVFMCNDNVDDGDQQYRIPYMGYPVMKDGNDLSNIGTLKDKNYTPVVLRRKSVQQETTINGYNSEFLEIGDTITLSFSSRKSWIGSSNNWNIEETVLNEWDYDNSVFDASLNNNGTVNFTVVSIPDENNSTISCRNLEKVIIIAPKYKSTYISISDWDNYDGEHPIIRNNAIVSVSAKEEQNAGYTDFTQEDVLNSNQYTITIADTSIATYDSNTRQINVNKNGTTSITISINNGPTLTYTLECYIAIITITPSGFTLAVGEYQDLIINYQQGQNEPINVTNSCTFEIYGGGSQYISLFGNRVTAIAAGGSSTIMVHYNDIFTSTSVSTYSYTPPEPECEYSLEISGPDEVEMNEEFQLTATYYTECDDETSDSDIVTSNATWTIVSGNNHLSYISKGKYKWASGYGTAEIKVTYLGETDTFTVTRDPEVSYGLILTPNKTVLNAGESATVTASYVKYNDGIPESLGTDVTASVNWTMSSPSHLTRSNNVFTWASEGTTTITATYNEINKSIDIDTNVAPEVSVNKNSFSFDEDGGTDTFTVIATGDWTIVKSDPWAFISISPASGTSGETEVTVTCAESDSELVTEATLQVKPLLGDSVGEIINISRSGINPYEFEKISSDPTILGSGTDFQLSIKSTKNGIALPITASNVEISSSTSGGSIGGIQNLEVETVASGGSITGEYVIIFSCSANPSSSGIRKSIITISHPESSSAVNPISFEVTQGAGESSAASYITINPAKEIAPFDHMHFVQTLTNTHISKKINVAYQTKQYGESSWVRQNNIQLDPGQEYTVNEFTMPDSYELDIQIIEQYTSFVN